MKHTGGIDKAACEARRESQAEGAQRLIESAMLDDLLAKIHAGEVQLDGNDGFVQQLIKAGLQRGLQAELTEHVGYEKGDLEARLFENSRDGSLPKTVGTTAGGTEHAIPRDRNGSFTTRLVPTSSRRLSHLDEMLLSLYAGGMTVRDIEHHLVSTLGSHEAISNITDETADEVLAWQSRPLEAFYSLIYLDALVIRVRDGGHVRNKTAHIAVGVDMDGIKHVLCIWIQANEGAKFWASVCAELANRGVRDVRIVRVDGLTGFPRGDRGDLAGIDGSDLRDPPDPKRDAIRRLRAAQGRRRRAEADLPGLDCRCRSDGAGRVQGVAAGAGEPQVGAGVRGRLGTVHPGPRVPARTAGGSTRPTRSSH